MIQIMREQCTRAPSPPYIRRMGPALPDGINSWALTKRSQSLVEAAKETVRIYQNPGPEAKGPPGGFGVGGLSAWDENPGKSNRKDGGQGSAPKDAGEKCAAHNAGRRWVAFPGPAQQPAHLLNKGGLQQLYIVPRRPIPDQVAKESENRLVPRKLAFRKNETEDPGEGDIVPVRHTHPARPRIRERCNPKGGRADGCVGSFGWVPRVIGGMGAISDVSATMVAEGRCIFGRRPHPKRPGARVSASDSRRIPPHPGLSTGSQARGVAKGTGAAGGCHRASGQSAD